MLIAARRRQRQTSSPVVADMSAEDRNITDGGIAHDDTAPPGSSPTDDQRSTPGSASRYGGRSTDRSVVHRGVGKPGGRGLGAAKDTA